jgi:hypothetical protein
MKSVFRSLVATVVTAGCLGGIVSVEAIQITPESYSFVPGARQGSYSYADETGRQLIDGLYGSAYLLDQSYADPYVGWMTELVTLHFQFEELTTFDSVTVSALQKWLGNIVLPDVHLYTSVDGVNWSPVGSLITPEDWRNDYAKKMLTLSGLNITTEHLQIELARNDKGPWIFVDEVLFSGTVPEGTIRVASVTTSTAVPDAASTFALLGIGFSSLVFFRRKS